MTFDLSAIGRTGDVATSSYDWQRSALYALAIGAKADELPHVYERFGPLTYPTFALMPALLPVIKLVDLASQSNPRRVHSAQSMTVHAAVPPEGTLAIETELRAIRDHGKFATVVVGTRSLDGGGKLLVEGEWTFLFPGAGGFGGPAPPPETRGSTERGAPTFVRREATSPEQALLYRLASADFNPLHVDAEVAKTKGMDKPILHGLCTFGFFARAFIAGAAGGDASRVRHLAAQFRKPTLPGSIIETRGFSADASGEWHLEAVDGERGEVLLGNGVGRIATGGS